MTNKIVRISNIRKVKNPSKIEYKKITLNNLDENGYVKIEEESTVKEVNPKTIDSNKLCKGDIILGYGGKVNKIGLIDKDSLIDMSTLFQTKNRNFYATISFCNICSSNSTGER